MANETSSCCLDFKSYREGRVDFTMRKVLTFSDNKKMKVRMCIDKYLITDPLDAHQCAKFKYIAAFN